ncbi:MAG: hypothetical protein AAGI37_15465 [Planctomycetota bacterium]
MSQASLSDAIYDALAAVQSEGTLYADLSGRLRWIIGETALQTPLLAWQFLGDVPERFFLAADETRDVSVQFDLYTDRVDGASAHDAIRQKARALLDRVTLTASGFTQVQCWIDDYGASPVAEGDAYRTTMTGTLLAQ